MQQSSADKNIEIFPQSPIDCVCFKEICKVLFKKNLTQLNCVKLCYPQYAI